MKTLWKSFWAAGAAAGAAAYNEIIQKCENFIQTKIKSLKEINY